MAAELATDENFKQFVEDNGKIIVKYYADWCGSCKLFSPKYKRLSNDEKFSDILFLVVNAEKSPETRKFAGVTNLPFFAVLKNGEIVDSYCTNKEEAVVSLLESLH